MKVDLSSIDNNIMKRKLKRTDDFLKENKERNEEK